MEPSIEWTAVLAAATCEEDCNIFSINAIDLLASSMLFRGVASLADFAE
jgi:hypothetical protein